MNKDVLYVSIYNIINIICWTIIAILFDKWWILLFSILTYASLKHRAYRKVCDNCGKKGPPAESSADAESKAKAAGWIKYDDKDFCCLKCHHEFTKNENIIYYRD